MAPSEEPLALLERSRASAKTLRVTFMERYSESGRLIRLEAGTAYFLRPGKMRWEYEKPEKNLFLVDGKYAWFYALADRMVTRVPVDKSDDWRTPMAFLTSGAKLSRVCARIQRVSSEPASQPNASGYSCTPRNKDGSTVAGDQPRPIYFELTEKGELLRLKMDESASQSIEFRFQHWEWNPPLDKSLFTFSPPLGVAIVDGLLPEATGTRQK